MSMGFGHLIGAWAVGLLWQYFNRKKLSNTTWFCLLLGGILPDIDNLLDWTLKTELHRTFTHSFLFALFIGILLYLVLSFLKTNGTKKYFANINHLHCAVALSLGVLTHLFLDLFSSPGIPLLWPLSYYFGYQGITFLLHPGRVFDFAPEYIYKAVFDMGLGTAWILFLTARGKLRP